MSGRDFSIPDLVVVHEKSVERVGLMFSPRDELKGDRYEPPVVHKAGAVARMAVPVAVEFDPAVLCVRR
ncbi:hypothetical protein ACGFJC_00390 [Nonomuraea fuscirosea]|uniref:hypothetical protein n=1 Tax=Nonomuraea fuscirosea TaxID=1291556 RepID=UPI00371C8000